MRWYRELDSDYKQHKEFLEYWHTLPHWVKVLNFVVIFLIPLHPIGIAFWFGVYYILK